MTDLLLWLVTAELVGLAAFPLVFRAFPRLSDRGWGIAVPAGMLIVSTLVWLLSYAGILPNSAWAWWLVVILVAAGGVFAVRRHVPELRLLLRERWPALAVSQVVFIVFFLLFALLRANDPSITNTEKPMEIMMLNAVVSTDSAPPADLWLAGEPVAYYYGGYWNLGGIATLSTVKTASGFNLSLALIAAMAASGIFSLVYSMAGRDGASVRAAALSGVAAAALLLLLASLAGWWELAANSGAGSDGFYNWLAIDGLQRNPDPGSWRPEQFWWWFRASRVINTFNESGTGLDFTIQEFPAFSLILGDLHPHVISIPFVIAGLAAAYNLLTSPGRWGFMWIRRNPFSAVAIGLIVGTSGFINQADILLMAALFGGVVALKAYGESGRSLLVSTLRAAPPLAVIAGAGVLVFAPFYFGTLGGQLQSPPVAPAEFGTRPVHFLTVWGVFLLVTAPFLAHVSGPMARRYAGAGMRVLAVRLREAQRSVDDEGETRRAATPQSPVLPVLPDDPRLAADRSVLRRLDRWVWVTPLLLTVVPYVGWLVTHIRYNDLAQGSDVITRLGTALPLGLLFSALFFVAVRKAHLGSTPASLFGLLLATLSVYMLFGAELFFVHDLFGNRMNTVFKFYYQAWIMLSVVAGYGAFYWARTHGALSGWPVIASRTAAVALAVLLVGPAWYPVAAAYSKTSDNTGPATLDGWAFLDRFAIADGKAIDWLLAEAEPGSRIVEAVGGSYTDHGRISAATGLPAVLGWAGHERQWRGSDELFSGREADVRVIYETIDEAEAGRLLDKYEVTYVVIGARERAGYPALEASKFGSLGAKVFESDGISIYQVRGHAS